MKVISVIIMFSTLMQHIFCFMYNPNAKGILRMTSSRRILNIKSTFDDRELFNRDDKVSKDFASDLIAKEIERPEVQLRGKSIGNFGRGDLVVFVVDMSMPGAASRLRAVNSAVQNILPHGKVALIGCMQGSAKVVLQPTSSMLTAARTASQMKKSVMGNVAAGIRLSQEVARDALLSGNTERVVSAFVVDGKAYGLKRAGATCKDDICDLDLLQSAYDVSEQKDAFSAMGMQMETIIVDTASTIYSSEKSSPEGLSLASASNGEYYHETELTGNKLLRRLKRIKMKATAK